MQPTILPYSHLFDLDHCAQFISDFLFYEPKPYEGVLWSPTYVLATQIGNSLEISNILASFLIGFGFQAYVVGGWVNEAVSRQDRTAEKCPYLHQDQTESEAEGSHLTTKYTPKKPPDLKSKYVQFLNKLKQESNLCKNALRRAQLEGHAPMDPDEAEDGGQPGPKEEAFFHAWVYIDLGEQHGLFIESTTGQKRPLNDPAYISINALWNHENYWLNNEANEGWKEAKWLDLADGRKWIKFVCDLEMIPKSVVESTNSGSTQPEQDSPKRYLYIQSLNSSLFTIII